MHILMISDDPSLQQGIGKPLAYAGHAVEQTADLPAARALLARGDFDVALCDLDMPGGDWLAFLRESRQAGIEAALVIVTACDSAESAFEALRAGASDYITKPATGEHVLHRLGQIALLRGLREENRVLRLAAGTPSLSVSASTPGAATENGPLRSQLRRYESEIIMRALEDADGDRRIAARRLGIGLSSLYRKIEELAIRDRVRASP